MSPKFFRVIDTGIRAGRFNVALDQALIEARKADRIPDTIRFLRFQPSVLIGRHQVLSSEVDEAYCAARGIELGRRVTGGGAIYLDAAQLGWELIFDKATLGLKSLADLTREICEAAATGLRELGVAAAFRPRNDIEVDGRKLCGTGGFFDGSTIFYQGTVLIDLDTRVMSGALKIPYDKHAKHGAASPEERIVTLRELVVGDIPSTTAIQNALLQGFQTYLGIEPLKGELSTYELDLAERLHGDEIGTEAFVREIDDPLAADGVQHATLATKGGTVSVFLKVSQGSEPRIRSMLMTGDFFATPPRLIPDLEAHLRDARLIDIESKVDEFFSQAEVDVLSAPPAELITAIQAAASAERARVD